MIIKQIVQIIFWFHILSFIIIFSKFSFNSVD